MGPCPWFSLPLSQWCSKANQAPRAGSFLCTQVIRKAPAPTKAQTRRHVLATGTNRVQQLWELSALKLSCHLCRRKCSLCLFDKQTKTNPKASNQRDAPSCLLQARTNVVLAILSLPPPIPFFKGPSYKSRQNRLMLNSKD